MDSANDTKEYLRIASELETSAYGQDLFIKSLEGKSKQVESELASLDDEMKQVELNKPYLNYVSNFDSFIYVFFKFDGGVYSYASMAGDGCTANIVGVVSVIAFIGFLGIMLCKLLTSVFHFHIGGGKYSMEILCIVGVLIITHLIPGIVSLLGNSSLNRDNEWIYNKELSDYQKKHDEISDKKNVLKENRKILLCGNSRQNKHLAKRRNLSRNFTTAI